jgi:threonine/homoserine/homoserine lactone efflux protein
MANSSYDHVVKVAEGAVIGGLATGVVVVAAPLVLPALGLAALATTVAGVGTALPWLGAAVGGWMGHNAAEKNAPPA